MEIVIRGDRDDPEEAVRRVLEVLINKGMLKVSERNPGSL
jgi:hypothetical protein